MLPLATPVSGVVNGLMVLVSITWYTRNKKAATMASRKSFIHRDTLRYAALVGPAGGAADRSLEEEEEEIEEEEEEVGRGRLLTLLTVELSV